MKIKCKKCGKHFDPDMYSGLCPKCGTYNGTHMGDSDVSQYLSSGYQGEQEHIKLHEVYGDTGHDEMAHQNLHETYDQGYDVAHPAYEEIQGDVPFGSVSDMPRRKKKRPGLTAVLAALLVLLPFLSLGFLRIWEAQAVEKFLTCEIEQVPLENGKTLVFSDELFRSPVEVTVVGMDLIERPEHVKEGKVLAAVRVKASSENYSYDARINKIALKYESGGNSFYQQPLGTYYLEVYLHGLGLTKDDMLTAYSLGNGEMQEGYWFFCIPVDAQDLELSIMASKGRGSQEAFLEGTIPLEDVGTTELTDREAGQ